jgi:hypothetical protein
MAEARHERPEDEDARAHLLHELVGGLGADARARRDVDLGRRDLHVSPQKPEEGSGRIDVAQRRHIAQPARTVREERGAQDGKRCVLRATDLNGAPERPPGADADCVHLPGLPEFRLPAK